MIFLDTHVVIWLYANEIGLLSTSAIKAMEENTLYISPMVLLELQYLYEKPKPKLKVSEHIILKFLSQKIGLKVIETNFKAIIEVAKTLTWTRDSFDRIIVAETQVNHGKLVTKDHHIRQHVQAAIW